MSLRNRAPRWLEVAVAIALGLEALLFAISAVNGMFELVLVQPDYKARTASAEEASGAFLALVLSLGIKVIDGSAYFLHRDRRRRAVVIAVPAIQIALAAFATWVNIDTGDNYWEPSLVALLIGLPAARVLAPRWNEGLAPKPKAKR